MRNEQLTKCSEAEGVPVKPVLAPLVILNYLPCQGVTSDVILYVPCFGVGFCTISPSVCLVDIHLGLGN